MRIAMVGTRGVPPRYGGFETAVAELGRRLVERRHEVVVYCRYKGQRLAEHNGMRLVNLPALRLKAAETLSHTALSVLHLSARPCDVAVVFNAANAVALPLLRARGIPALVHVDGLEWKRAKWGATGRRYYLAAERMSARWADRLVVDSRAIGDYYRATYGVGSEYVAYGAPILVDVGSDRLGQIGVERGGYHLVVARLEPENNVEMVVDGYRRSAARLPLLVVGSAPYGDYPRAVRARADGDPRVRLLGSLWDQDVLDQLYGNAVTYLHGHSVGGTNPGLLRAMGAGRHVVALDVAFNREVLGDCGSYFGGPDDLAARLADAESDREGGAALGQRARDRAALLYDWARVTDSYEQLCEKVVRRTRGSAPSRAGVPIDRAGWPDSRRRRAGRWG